MAKYSSKIGSLIICRSERGSYPFLTRYTPCVCSRNGFKGFVGTYGTRILRLGAMQVAAGESDNRGSPRDDEMT